jgi:hypothetical protein
MENDENCLLTVFNNLQTTKNVSLSIDKGLSLFRDDVLGQVVLEFRQNKTNNVRDADIFP